MKEAIRIMDIIESLVDCIDCDIDTKIEPRTRSQMLDMVSNFCMTHQCGMCALYEFCLGLDRFEDMSDSDLEECVRIIRER